MSLNIIFLSFLENQKYSGEFQREVKSLQEYIDQEENLQTDGPRSSKIPPPVVLEGVDVDLCRSIGARLAEMGDQFEREGLVDQKVVQSLIDDILDNALTEDRFAAAVKSLLESVPPGMEQEKAGLTLAMKLTSDVGRSAPALLYNCFSTAVSYIQRNCLAAVQGLTQQQ